MVETGANPGIISGRRRGSMTLERSRREIRTLLSWTTAGKASHCLTPLIITSRLFKPTSSSHLSEVSAIVFGRIGGTGCDGGAALLGEVVAPDAVAGVVEAAFSIPDDGCSAVVFEGGAAVWVGEITGNGAGAGNP